MIGSNLLSIGNDPHFMNMFVLDMIKNDRINGQY